MKESDDFVSIWIKHNSPRPIEQMFIPGLFLAIHKYNQKVREDHMKNLKNMEDYLSVWVVCEHPSDYPDYYTARRHISLPGRPRATNDLLKAKTLEELRGMLPPCLFRMPRASEDDPIVVEVWF